MGRRCGANCAPQAVAEAGTGGSPSLAVRQEAQQMSGRRAGGRSGGGDGSSQVMPVPHMSRPTPLTSLGDGQESDAVMSPIELMRWVAGCPRSPGCVACLGD